MCKPLTDEELWGDPDAVQAADRVIEDILGEDEESDGGNLEQDAPCFIGLPCTNCGEPPERCVCHLEDGDED